MKIDSKKILKNFGPQSRYWKNLKLRKKYKKVKDWRSLVNGPWIHQNIIETIKNIRLNKKFPGGKKLMSLMVIVLHYPIFYSVTHLKILRALLKL